MADADLIEVEFLLGWCAHCAREVLTAVTSAATKVEERACVHCDTTIVAPFSQVAGDDLAARGYGAIEDTSGCGRPDCGNGRCGTRPASP
jgi:hypothetical protein